MPTAIVKMVKRAMFEDDRVKFVSVKESWIVGLCSMALFRVVGVMVMRIFIMHDVAGAADGVKNTWECYRV